MTVEELKVNIIENRCPNLLIFTGPELATKTFYLSKLSSSWIDIEDYKELVFNVKSFLQVKTFYKIQGGSLGNIKEEEIDKLKRNILNSSNVYVFYFNSEEKVPPKVQSELGPYIVNFEYLNMYHLCEHFKDVDLNIDEFTELFEICNYDYTKIKLEVAKIKALSSYHDTTDALAFIKLKDEGIIKVPITSSVFDLTNAILEGSLTKTNYYLDKIKQSDTSALVILSLLYNNFLDLYLIQTTKGNTDLRKKMNYDRGKVYAISKNLNKYTDKELERNLKVIQYVDQSIKSNKIRDKVALDFLVLNLII